MKSELNFDYDEQLINDWERNDSEVEFNPLALKHLIDSWIREGVSVNQNQWDFRKNTKYLKVWTRW